MQQPGKRETTMSRKVSKSERDEAINRLREWLKPGDTVYTILRSVSRSGMKRAISVLQLTPTGSHEHYAGSANYNENIAVGSLVYNVALACGGAVDCDRDAIIMHGTGEDKGYAIVYEIGRAVWPDGFGCVGKGCRSNDHSNGDGDYTPHSQLQLVGDFEHWHRDGGYAFAQRWL